MRRRKFLQTSASAMSLPLLATLTTGQSSAAQSGSQSGYEPLSSVDIEGAREAAVSNGGDTAYVAATDGFAVVDISDPASPEVAAEVRDIDTESDMSHSGQPLEPIYDIWASGERLVVSGPAQPNSASAQGFALFDVSNPSQPQQLDWFATDYYIHNSYFTDQTVYLTGSGLGDQPLVIVDVNDDEPEELARWSIIEEEEGWGDLPIPMRVLHDVYVQDDIAYLPYWDSGAWIVDISDPSSPEVLSRVGDYELEDLKELSTRESRLEGFIPEGNAHYTEVNEDASVLLVGKEAWAFENPETGESRGGAGGVDLYDISDPENPSKLTSIDPPESRDQTQTGWFTTSHNCNLVNDRMYTSWYYGGVKVHDISDPANPEELAWWRDPTEASFWTAQAGVSGDFFVGASMAVQDTFGRYPNETRAALYLFPDEAGTQENAPDLTASESTPTPEPTATPTPEPTATPTPEPTATPTPEPTATPASGMDDTETPVETETPSSDGNGPGLTVGSGLAGLGGAAYLLRRRLRDDEE